MAEKFEGEEGKTTEIGADIQEVSRQAATRLAELSKAREMLGKQSRVWPDEVGSKLKQIAENNTAEYEKNPEKWIEKVDEERAEKIENLRTTFYSGDEEKIKQALDDIDSMVIRQYGNLVSPQDVERLHEFLNAFRKGMTFKPGNLGMSPGPEAFVKHPGAFPTILRAGIEFKDFVKNRGTYINLDHPGSKRLNCLGCLNSTLHSEDEKGLGVRLRSREEFIHEYNKALTGLSIFQEGVLDVKKWQYTEVPPTLNW